MCSGPGLNLCLRSHEVSVTPEAGRASMNGGGWWMRCCMWLRRAASGGFFTRTLRWSKISAGRAARELFCQGYGRETAKDQMLVNPSTNVSGSKADDGDPFLKG